MRFVKGQKKCPYFLFWDKTTKEIGIDLNRNYGLGFGRDNKGSFNKVCHFDYRGPHAWSEPEVRAMRDLVISFPKMRFALNFHAYGNLLIFPFNAMGKKNSYLTKFYKKAAKFY